MITKFDILKGLESKKSSYFNIDISYPKISSIKNVVDRYIHQKNKYKIATPVSTPTILI